MIVQDVIHIQRHVVVEKAHVENPCVICHGRLSSLLEVFSLYCLDPFSQLDLISHFFYCTQMA